MDVRFQHSPAEMARVRVVQFGVLSPDEIPVRDYSNYTSLLITMLEGVSGEDMEAYYEDIIKAANEVIESVLRDELEKYMSLKSDPDDEGAESSSPTTTSPPPTTKSPPPPLETLEYLAKILKRLWLAFSEGDEEAMAEFVAKGGMIGTMIGPKGVVKTSDKESYNYQKELQDKKLDQEALKLWFRRRNEVIAELQEKGFDVE